MANSKSLLILCVLKYTVLPIELIKYITEMTMPTISICSHGYIVNESLFMENGKKKHDYATSIVSTFGYTFTLWKGQVIMYDKSRSKCFPHNELQLFIDSCDILPVKSMYEHDMNTVIFLTNCHTLIIWNINRSPEIIGKNIGKFVGGVFYGNNNDRFKVRSDMIVKYEIQWPICFSFNNNLIISDVMCRLVYTRESFYLETDIHSTLVGLGLKGLLV